MNFHEMYEKYYTAQSRGDIPPNSTGKDRSIIETLEKYSRTDKTTTGSKPLERKKELQECRGTRTPRRGTKRKRSGAAAHSTAGSRSVKTNTKDIWKLIKAR